MNGVYVMNNKNQEGFTELTLGTIEMRTTLEEIILLKIIRQNWY